ncbi:hypothetical protein MYW52_13550 [Pseudomonas juntendi]|uniref:hypothetical protein n=1 Tax=Pseudomonas juntendi TaxID=2666183 RepID=UPI001FFC6C5B|nr:hypothetical protein [Pseudomonas juntendi]MCK2116528.1 hypothetical protein [Pseudomonas juntendi]
MSITQTLEDYKALIESLPSKPKVDLFSGTVVEDTLKNITLDGKQCYVLLACGGGPFVSEKPALVCDAVFGAFIIARSDPDTKGVSRQAMSMGVEISRLLKKYRGISAGNPNLPKILSFEELLSGFKGNNFSAWQLSWTHFVSFD